eukprot:CAMPEP_0177767926 /NCGR_PEP_ID=MMETSP0491_2-20121128/9423_1 /TAXON_ID=63592 /ORGANISM="Tetraselmis chuii, Strain PLY429" /LENGTH=101 /DNA_ID=CAMNT_0019284649 /DNA_START=250 /DNA_END=555 /DNA_ORIENTATION=-
MARCVARVDAGRKLYLRPLRLARCVIADIVQPAVPLWGDGGGVLLVQIFVDHKTVAALLKVLSLKVFIAVAIFSDHLSFGAVHEQRVPGAAVDETLPRAEL